MPAKMPSTHPELLEQVKRALKKPPSKWKLNDNRAWQEFEERYRPVLLRKGKRNRLGPEDCEDYAQEVMFAVRRRLPDFVYDRARGPFGGWLMKIASSMLADVFRKRRRSIPTEQPPSSVIRVGGVDPKVIPPDEAALASERLAVLLKSLRELAADTSESHFTLFVEVEVKERTCAQVAREMGIAPDTARKIVERLRKKLKEIVRRHDLDG